MTMLEELKGKLDIARVRVGEKSLGWYLRAGLAAETGGEEGAEDLLDAGVRAVLLALREPDAGMIDAGIDAAEEVQDYTADSHAWYRIDTPSDMPKPVFTAMIDAALATP